MDNINMREAIDQGRRCFFGAAALTFTAAKLGVVGAAHAETNPAPLSVIKPGTNTSFGPPKQIDAGVLNVGYAEVGPPNGSPVFLLHGWPYDIHDYIEVAPILAAHGYRVIVPHLRGHGSTLFLETATPRSGQQAAIGVDVVALMDALKIPNAVLAGYDWGGRAACVVAALWPEKLPEGYRDWRLISVKRPVAGDSPTSQRASLAMRRCTPSVSPATRLQETVTTFSLATHLRPELNDATSSRRVSVIR
jgi:pimeloyl-ACP methyl ester carboxylesterase